MANYNGVKTVPSALFDPKTGGQDIGGTNVSLGGGSAAVDWFQMLGVSDTGGAIYWKVSGSSDFAGTSAPVVVTNVTLVRTWTV